MRYEIKVLPVTRLKYFMNEDSLMFTAEAALATVTRSEKLAHKNGLSLSSNPDLSCSRTYSRFERCDLPTRAASRYKTSRK